MTKIERIKFQMKKRIALSASITFLVLFLIFTVLVITVDIQPIGPNNSNVGLATMNGAVADAIGYNDTWYTISEYVGYIPLAIAGSFAFLGFFQAIQRKSLAKVDRQLYILASFYMLLLSVYCLFEAVVINCRPILLDGKLEASFPSSHTMLAICIMSTAIFEFHALIKERKALLIAADTICIAIGSVVVIGRLLSGVHWLSDIIASIILSGALVCFFVFLTLLAKDIETRKKNSQNSKETTVND